MRASRLLLMLLLVQNRGRMTSEQLAAELEVSKRTILRDVEALSEAGLPMVVRAGRGGGIELGFNHRTRLTGLSTDEAEALGVLLGRESPELAALGLAGSAARAKTKLIESLPDSSRGIAQRSASRFRIVPPDPPDDERVPALAEAVRRQRVVRIRAREPDTRTVHPVGLVLRSGGWAILDALDPGIPVLLAECGTVNISSPTFADPPQDRREVTQLSLRGTIDVSGHGQSASPNGRARWAPACGGMACSRRACHPISGTSACVEAWDRDATPYSRHECANVGRRRPRAAAGDRRRTARRGWGRGVQPDVPHRH